MLERQVGRDITETLYNVNCFPFTKQEFPLLNWVIFIIKSDSFFMAEERIPCHTSSNSRQQDLNAVFCFLFQKFGG